MPLSLGPLSHEPAEHGIRSQLRQLLSPLKRLMTPLHAPIPPASSDVPLSSCSRSSPDIPPPS